MRSATSSLVLPEHLEAEQQHETRHHFMEDGFTKMLQQPLSEERRQVVAQQRRGPNPALVADESPQRTGDDGGDPSAGSSEAHSLGPTCETGHTGEREDGEHHRQTAAARSALKQGAGETSCSAHHAKGFQDSAIDVSTQDPQAQRGGHGVRNGNRSHGEAPMTARNITPRDLPPGVLDAHLGARLDFVRSPHRHFVARLQVPEHFDRGP
jgi:hypothetical protein